MAGHLLNDSLTGQIDAAMVFSNDSDLRLALELARERVPVATINPTANPTARDLRGEASSGAGRHWWRRLSPADFHDHQLPNQVGAYAKPLGW